MSECPIELVESAAVAGSFAGVRVVVEDTGVPQRGEEGRALRDERVRALAGAALGVPAAEVQLEHDAHGRPAIAGGGRRLEVVVSTSGTLLAVGVSFDHRLGLDLERLEPALATELLVRDCFTPAEQARHAALPEAGRYEAFLRVWTAKEAVAKALGEGIGLREVETQPRDGALGVARVPGGDPAAAGWALAHFQARGAVLAVAARP